MLVKIECLWRDGKQVPRWQLGQLAEFHGDLKIQERRDEYLCRFMRVARLLDEITGIELLEPLHDVAVLWILENRMAITGFERDALSTRAYAQT